MKSEPPIRDGVRPPPAALHMRAQARPFTVEVKTRRKSPAAPNWDALIDELPPDELPTRRIHADEQAEESPLERANRVFSASATNAISASTKLTDLTASVFGSKPSEPTAARANGSGAAEPSRGRILPSLVPLNPFEPSRTEEEVGHLRRRKAATRTAGTERTPEQEPVQDDSIGLTEAASGDIIAPGAPPSSRSQRRNATSQRATARVRAGEGWKRRRLPKACW